MDTPSEKIIIIGTIPSYIRPTARHSPPFRMRERKPRRIGNFRHIIELQSKYDMLVFCAGFSVKSKKILIGRRKSIQKSIENYAVLSLQRDLLVFIRIFSSYGQYIYTNNMFYGTKKVNKL